MAQFTIHKITSGGSIAANDGVYFELAGGSSPLDEWFYMRVTDQSPSVDVKNLAIYTSPGGQASNHQVAGIYFSQIPSVDWDDNWIAQIIGRYEPGYDGEGGLGRSLALGADFNIAWDVTAGTYVLGVDGVGTGVTTLIAEANETNGLLQVKSSSNGSSGTFGTTATINATDNYLDVRFAPMASRTAILGARNTGAGTAVPNDRKIEAGVLTTSPSTSETGDINFESPTYTGTELDGLLRIMVSATGLDSGVDSWGKQYALDESYFETTTLASGGITIDQITLSQSVGWTVAVEGASGTDFISIGDQLDFQHDATTGTIFEFDLAGVGTATPDVVAKLAQFPAADRIVFFDQSQGGSGQLNWLQLGTGLSISGTTLNATAAQNIWATFSADTGSTTANTTADTLTVTGTNGITTQIVGDTLTIQYNENFTTDWKESVRVATTANVNLSSAPASIDGITLSNGDRVLVKDQSTGGQNGIYDYNGNGATMTRAEDMNANDEISAGNTTSVEEGNTNGNSIWQITTDDPIDIGDAHTWTKIASNAAFLDVGIGLIEDSGSSPSKITFAEPGTSTPVTLNSTHNGIYYHADSIEVAIDSVYFDFNSERISHKAQAAKTVFVNSTNASARPTYLASPTAHYVLKTNSSNNGLEWGLLVNGNISNTANISLTKLQDINEYTWLGNPDAGSGKPVATQLTPDSIIVRNGTDDIAPMQLDGNYEFLAHNASNLGVRTFSTDNFEWDDSTPTQLNAKWTTQDW